MKTEYELWADELRHGPPKPRNWLIVVVLVVAFFGLCLAKEIYTEAHWPAASYVEAGR